MEVGAHSPWNQRTIDRDSKASGSKHPSHFNVDNSNLSDYINE